METNPHTSAWRQLLTTAQAANPAPHNAFAQLATVVAGTGGHETRPAVRTVTPRFFLNDGRLLITTDLRNDKVQDLAAHPLCELCWYLTDTREQFRLAGRAHCLSAVEAAKEAHLEAAMLHTWQSRSDAARASFTWPQPKRKRGDTSEFATPVPAAPPENFALLLLDISTVDYLNIGAQAHERKLFSKLGGQWLARAVNP